MDVLSSFCNEYVFFLFRWKVSELIINGVQRQDDGLYECQARNEGGQFFKSGHIQVGNNNNKFLLGLPYPKKMSSLLKKTLFSLVFNKMTFFVRKA